MQLLERETEEDKSEVNLTLGIGWRGELETLFLSHFLPFSHLLCHLHRYNWKLLNCINV